ncbi:hypothetical protein FSB73_03200 [Arachidicoccus ginsenosidivorans]|uniref:Uncharacterized protein n=1 Tax=Arachidicoccus ginsenosidivorans TaxID=496057 RepID=A0A5B8VIR3_9BACT|nr:hypothetical protein [Arachidicoccus ginsenosidivorans]QEC70832.1 hypothetical protein FSB73_03200 [Arachidicoccus ginsenosidivorans]
MIQGKIRFLLASAVLMILLGREGNAQPKKVDQLYPLWTGGEIPTSNAVPVLKHVKFIEIKNMNRRWISTVFCTGWPLPGFNISG